MTPEELFKVAGITPTGTAKWGDPIGERGPGVYVIAIAAPKRIKFDPRFEDHRDRWRDDQNIVYVGRSGSLRKRLGQFYRHVYGAHSPHRGGQAILLLGCDKIIRWAATPDHANAERQLLEAFEQSVGGMPFGNRARSARMVRD
jgi:hypothetical protein